MEALRSVELTGTNSPCALYLNLNFLPPFQYIYSPKFLGGHREEGTPDPIPNSEVKLFIADDTAYLHVGK